MRKKKLKLLKSCNLKFIKIEIDISLFIFIELYYAILYIQIYKY